MLDCHSIYVNNIYFNPQNDGLRFVMTFPILRAFTAIRRIRLLLFTLIGLVPSVSSVLALLVVVFLFYGQLGVFLFEGKLTILQVRIATLFIRVFVSWS